MGPGIERVEGVVQHQAAVDPQAKGIGIGHGAAVVVDNRLDQPERGGNVVVHDGANGRFAQRDRHGVTIVLGAADAVPGARGVAGRTVAFGKIIHARLETRPARDAGSRATETGWTGGSQGPGRGQGRTAVAVDDFLDQREAGNGIIVGNRTGGILIQSECDAAVWVAVAAPRPWLVTGQANL